VRKNPVAQMLAFGVVAVAILLVIALSIHWFPADGSIQAGRIHTLYKVLLIVSVPVFVLVVTVVLFSVLKFRMRPGQELQDGPPIHGNTRLEVVWTAVPAVLLVGLCAYSFTILHANEKSKRGEMTINVTERQFAFEFSYRNAQNQVVASPDLVLADHQPVLFHIRSLDVIHSLFVPEFSEKIDAVPGIVTTIRVTPNRLGDYAAECTELCGAGHSLMRAPVKVLTPASFRTWLAAQKPNAAPPVGTPPAAAAEQGEPGAPSNAPPSSTGRG
jgi:cytochrome c oxidase subunit 2